MRGIIHFDDKTGEQINYGDKVKISVLTGEFSDRSIVKEMIYSPQTKAF